MKSFTRILIVSIVFAQTTYASDIPFFDVPQSSWFSNEIRNFIAEGYLDLNQHEFRPADPARRAEFLKLIVELNGGILDEIPSVPNFSDVSAGDWFFGYTEEAAREGWLKGDGNCYGTAPCFIRPHDPISRAEAAAIMTRAFGITRLTTAPAFADNSPGQWFTDAIQSAADHCIIRGDDGSRNVRPHDPLTRAEMVVMLHRVDEGKSYPCN